MDVQTLTVTLAQADPSTRNAALGLLPEKHWPARLRCVLCFHSFFSADALLQAMTLLVNRTRFTPTSSLAVHAAIANIPSVDLYVLQVTSPTFVVPVLMQGTPFLRACACVLKAMKEPVAVLQRLLETVQFYHCDQKRHATTTQRCFTALVAPWDWGNLVRSPESGSFMQRLHDAKRTATCLVCRKPLKIAKRLQAHFGDALMHFVLNDPCHQTMLHTLLQLPNCAAKLIATRHEYVMRIVDISASGFAFPPEFQATLLGICLRKEGHLFNELHRARFTCWPWDVAMLAFGAEDGDALRLVLPSCFVDWQDARVKNFKALHWRWFVEILRDVTKILLRQSVSLVQPVHDLICAYAALLREEVERFPS
jgi:hypothetical protein